MGGMIILVKAKKHKTLLNLQRKQWNSVLLQSVTAHASHTQAPAAMIVPPGEASNLSEAGYKVIFLQDQKLEMLRIPLYTVRNSSYSGEDQWTVIKMHS